MPPLTLTHTFTQPLSPTPLSLLTSHTQTTLSLPSRHHTLRCSLTANPLAETRNGNGFNSENYFDNSDLRKVQFESPEVHVKELEELSENWRRSKLAWLCKELPGHKRPSATRMLNNQKKWVCQDDATYLAVHLMRIRENESCFWVYKWMMQQSWFKFDFALATKLADYIGRDRKHGKCREIFDDIINQGRVPSESTFHILIVSYLSAESEDCLAEACDIYNRMIHLGGYRPRLSLHNAVFRAIVSRPGSLVKQYLRQAEFIFHNLVTCKLEIQKDIYTGLLWLHSYQDTIDEERISWLRKEMYLRGIKESDNVLLSIMRICSKTGNVDEAEKAWNKLLHCDGGVPYQAYLYKMEVHAKVGDHAKSLDTFRKMQEQSESVNAVAYYKIIEVVCQAQQVETAESLMKELIRSDFKPIAPSYLSLLNMYLKLSLHDKLESTFVECIQKCRANRNIYGIYLDSLVQTGDIVKAESIFNQMLDSDAIGVSPRSCNTILRAYLSCDGHRKAEKIYRFMRQKNYEVEPSLREKMDAVYSSKRNLAMRPMVLKLTPDQREILVGMLLGGLRVEHEGGRRKQPFICFEFKDNSVVHSVLRPYIYDKFHEWLQPSCKSADDNDDIPMELLTVPHISFAFYAEQFWPRGIQTIPKLIHRWLSPRALAYWYMYGGYRTSKGDILLKVKGSEDDIERIVKALKMKSLDVRVKQKNKVFWLGFLGSKSAIFWRLIEPHILDGLIEILKSDGHPSEDGVDTTSSMKVSSDSDSDDSKERYSDI